MQASRRAFLAAALAIAAAGTLLRPAGAAAAAKPVLIGIDAEFGLADSYSAEAIAYGVRIAIEEINAGGGVLGGRPLQLVERANASLPARSANNLRDLAAQPDLVAVFCGRFSPTVLDNLALIHELGMPLLDPWSAADRIVDHDFRPNFVFRLSLRDQWASEAMLTHLKRRGLKKVGLLSWASAWGRSTRKAAEDYVVRNGGMVIVGNRWVNWDESEAALGEKLTALREAGAQALLVTLNPPEAVILSRLLLALPPEQRLPVVSHWGVSGADLPALVGPRFGELDFKVVQTYSFIGDHSPTARRVVAAYNRLSRTAGARAIRAPVGVAHGYDLTHILARAIALAGSTERRAIRDGLERVGVHSGLVRRYAPPFSPTRHEALAPGDVFIARYAADGVLERLP